MTITKDTRLAWALARDDGMRSQHEIIVSRLETGCEVQVGAKGGVGAGVLADYAHIQTCIESLPAPVKSVGDSLNCRGVLNYKSQQRAETMAALSIAQMTAARLPGYKQWSPERQRMLYWLALAAMEREWVLMWAIPEKTDHKGREEGRTLDAPWKIGKWLRAKHGKSLDLKKWGREWSAAWQLLQESAQELDQAGMDEVQRQCYGHQQWKKAS